MPAAAALVQAAYMPYVIQLQRYGRYQEQLMVPAIRALGMCGLANLSLGKRQHQLHFACWPNVCVCCY